MKSAILGMTALIGSTGTAFAADAVKADQDPWTGVYFGAGLALVDGYASADVFDGNRDRFGEFDALAIKDQSFASRALNGTIEAGADVRLASRIVAGIGGSYDFGKTKGEMTADVSTGDSLQASAFDEDRFAAYGRLGLLLNDRAMVYGLAGWGHMDWEFEGSANGGKAQRRGGSEEGLVLGGGMETLLGHNLSLKLEYRFEDYGDISKSRKGAGFAFPHGSYDSLTSFRFDPTVQTIRAVVAYKLGAPGIADGQESLGEAGFASGFHAGLGGGMTALQHEARFAVSDSSGDTAALAFENFGAADPFMSLEAGYDHVMDNGFIAGLSGDYAYAASSDSFDVDNHDFSHRRTHVTGGFKTDHGLNLTARAGYLMAPDTLIYGLGGVGVQHVEGDFQVDTDKGFGSPVKSSVYQLDEWMPAGIAGAGIEALVSENLSLKLEYRHLVFADAKDKVYDKDGTKVHADLTSMSDQIRAIVSIRLN